MLEQFGLWLPWIRRGFSAEMFLCVVQGVLNQRRVRTGERSSQRMKVLVNRTW
jgi:hypothetical protein